jgi:hypothetical protein
MFDAASESEILGQPLACGRAHSSRVISTTTILLAVQPCSSYEQGVFLGLLTGTHCNTIRAKHQDEHVSAGGRRGRGH